MTLKIRPILLRRQEEGEGGGGEEEGEEEGEVDFGGEGIMIFIVSTSTMNVRPRWTVK